MLSATPRVMARFQETVDAIRGTFRSDQVSFSTRLRYLREAAGLTQEQLALACGFSGQSRVANYETRTGKAREPSIEDLIAISRALAVPVGVLVDPDEFAAYTANGPDVARKAAAITYLYMHAEDSAKRMIEAVAEAANPDYDETGRRRRMSA